MPPARPTIEQRDRPEPAGKLSLADTAADRVRAILGAAEEERVKVARDAEHAAAEVRGEAERKARAIRDGGVERSRAEVHEVAGSLARLVEHLDAAEREVQGAVALLRKEAARIERELSLLEGRMKRAS